MAPTGKPSRAKKKEPLKNKEAQTTEIAYASAGPLSSTSSGVVPVATADLEYDTLIGDANQLDATIVDEGLMNGLANGNYGYARPVQPTAKKAFPTSLTAQETENSKEHAEQRWNPSGHPLVKPWDQLKSWRDLRRCDGNGSFEVTTTPDTIRGSIEHLTTGYSPVFPSAYGTGAVRSQNSRTMVNRLLGTPGDEQNVSISPFPAARVPAWRFHVPSVMPTMEDETIRSDHGVTELAVMATEPAGIQASLAYNPRKNALKSGKGITPGQDERPYHGVIGSPLPRMDNYAFTPRQACPSTRNFQPAVNNENVRHPGPRTAPNRIETTRGQPAIGLNPSRLPFSPGITQAAFTTPNNRPMGHQQSQLFPFPDYNGEETTQVQTVTPSIPSTVRVANDLSTTLTNQNNQTEYEIAGYHHSDPTVLWADEMPTAIVPPSERHIASHLLGNGFLSTLDSDSTTFVEPNAPSTLPSELLEYLNERKERTRLHAEGDVWRAQHAAEVVRRHEEQFFARRAEEGDWGLKGWHMSAEYHGQPSAGKGRGGGFGGFGGFGGRGGRGGGRGGRGRGRGGFSGPDMMGQGF